MNASIVALLPVFAVIVLGAGLRRARVVKEEQWLAVDQLCYMVLFPAIIFKEIAAADFADVPVWSMAAAMMLALITMFTLLLVSRRQILRQFNLEGPQFASLFQGATRWHTFIALAIIPAVFGQGAMALGGLGAAAMIPILNVVNVWVHAKYVQHHAADARAIAVSIGKNPFVLSSLAGVIWQMLGLPLPWPLFDILDITGRGALGLALLAVGAGLRFDAAWAQAGPVIAATSLKLVVMPLFMGFWLWTLGVDGDAARVALLCGAVPTGSGAYVLARQMGGDAPMIANILTLQVLAAAFTIPLVLALSG